MLAWRDISGNLVHPHEWGILKSMDQAYCAALETEIADAQARARQEAERQR